MIAKEYSPATYEHAFPITPNDTQDIRLTQAIYVGSTGALTVVMFGGETVTFAGVQAGQVLPISITRVLDAGTDATGIIGLY